MFEAKIQSIIPTDGTLEIETEFINNARKFQICNVIDSLTEEEFISLQKSIMESFKAVEELMDVVKDGISVEQSYIEVFNRLNTAYLNSTEGSLYFRNMYLQLLKFLNTNRMFWSNAGEEQCFLTQKVFQEQVVEPFNLMKSSILQALFTREELKSRVDQGADFRKVKQMEKSNHLCEEIRRVLIKNTVGSVQKEIEKAPASLMDTALIQPISILRNTLIESKDEGRDSIASILDGAEEKLSIRKSLCDQIQGLTDCFLRKQSLWCSLASHDEALANLLKALKNKPSDLFKLNIHFLQNLQESSDWERRKFYSGRKFHCPSLENPNTSFNRDMHIFKSQIESNNIKYYNQFVLEIRQEEICAINDVFQKMLCHNPAGNQSIKLYQNQDSEYIYKKSVDDVMKDINDRYKYEALKTIFRLFFERLLTGDTRGEMQTKFGEEENIMDSNLQEIMVSVAELVWDEEEKGHLVTNPEQKLLNLYHNIESMRRVQEDEIIDAIISGPVYQKK